jgi:predicted dehydrogenase
VALRIAFLSTARINGALAAGAAEVDEVEVVAIASRDLGRAEAQARQLGIARAVGSYEAALEDPEVDAVYVSLPNALHVPWAIRALEAGKHVLCEKPLTRRPEDAERAFDAAQAAGRVLMEGFMWRHHPQARRLTELARTEIGQLRAVRAGFSFSLGRAGDVRLSGELDGGALMDVGCYCVSGMRLVAGEPERVFASRRWGATGWTSAWPPRCASGDVLGHFECGMDMPGSMGSEVVGARGSLLLTDPWHGREPRIELRRADGSVEDVEVERANPYAMSCATSRERPAGSSAPLPRPGRRRGAGARRSPRSTPAPRRTRPSPHDGGGGARRRDLRRQGHRARRGRDDRRARRVVLRPADAATRLGRAGSRDVVDGHPGGPRRPARRRGEPAGIGLSGQMHGSSRSTRPAPSSARRSSGTTSGRPPRAGDRRARRLRAPDRAHGQPRAHRASPPPSSCGCATTSPSTSGASRT